MTNADTWPERTPLNGAVDFTMMYVAHDAFARDLYRLAAASARGQAFTPQTLATWAMFTKQLHIHHTAEDTSLWPMLRAKAVQPDEVGVLDAMEMEHAQIDPHLHHVEQAIAAKAAAGLAQGIDALTRLLTAHMRHEEDAALPMVDTHLGREGWAAFGREIRRTQGGIRGGAQYLPWVLDDASGPMTTKVLRQLPVPARLLYRWVWAPRYRRRNVSS
jgi:hemerythrin-like domain-containing protein